RGSEYNMSVCPQAVGNPPPRPASMPCAVDEEEGFRCSLLHAAGPAIVIPGRAEGANPESRNNTVLASGFRVRRCTPSRNDRLGRGRPVENLPGPTIRQWDSGDAASAPGMTRFGS